MSSVRYRLWKHLKDMPASEGWLIGGTDVEDTVTPYTVRDRSQLCEPCSYSCKQCYFEPDATKLVSAPRLSYSEMVSHTAAAEFCLVVRGDDPLTPKLTEALLLSLIHI